MAGNGNQVYQPAVAAVVKYVTLTNVTPFTAPTWTVTIPQFTVATISNIVADGAYSFINALDNQNIVVTYIEASINGAAYASLVPSVSGANESQFPLAAFPWNLSLPLARLLVPAGATVDLRMRVDYLGGFPDDATLNWASLRAIVFPSS